MTARLALAAVLAAVLVLSHFTAYRAGRAAVRAAQAQQALEDVHEVRKLEARRGTLAAEAGDRARARERDLQRAAGAARDESERLRDAIAVAGRAAQSDAEACRRYAAAASGVLAEMEREGASMAREADQCVSDLMLLAEVPP